MYFDDSGEYLCRAVNDHGEATTKAMVTCKRMLILYKFTHILKNNKNNYQMYYYILNQ